MVLDNVPFIGREGRRAGRVRSNLDRCPNLSLNSDRKGMKIWDIMPGEGEARCHYRASRWANSLKDSDNNK